MATRSFCCLWRTKTLNSPPIEMQRFAGSISWKNGSRLETDKKTERIMLNLWRRWSRTVTPKRCRFKTQESEHSASEQTEKTETKHNIWYICHHGIYHPKKLNKIRVVFDCTAAYQRIVKQAPASRPWFDKQLDWRTMKVSSGISRLYVRHGSHVPPSESEWRAQRFAALSLVGKWRHYKWAPRVEDDCSFIWSNLVAWLQMIMRTSLGLPSTILVPLL